MVVDSSAIIAILRHEPEHLRFLDVVVKSSVCMMSAANYHETCIVLAGHGGSAQSCDVFEVLIATLAIQIVPFDAEQARLARDAFLRYGKGRHPAGLNLCDCVAYALARQRQIPLLFKGNDFARTDIVAAA